jgi:bifunctional non-homologous end joining protein LigD
LEQRYLSRHRTWLHPALSAVADKATASGPEWVYEIKQDGYRLMVCKREGRVRIYTRRGADWTKRFPRIVEAVQKLNVQSILIDGEVIICNESGLAIFDLLHSKKNDDAVTLCSVDLLELDGEDFRAHALKDRKARLQELLRKVRDGIQFNEHVEGDGPTLFLHACKLGCEGIVAKRIDLPYQSGRSKRWLKIKNPDSPAVRRADEGTF